MLFLIFIYYLVRGASESINASPIPSLDTRSSDPKRCVDLSHCRTIWNIIWSCLATIFSCTWVAIHPNIQCPKTREEKGWRCVWNPLWSYAKYRLSLFICALLLPEYVLAWAIRQFLCARKIARLNKKRRWSTTHGFFIIMGGLHLFKEETSDDQGASHENDEPLHPLRASDLVNCDDYKSFIMPTKAEIRDRGKRHWLSKSLVLFQTSWFVLQCIARAREHLPITHFEIVTLAYAAINFVTFIFWWDKPLNVDRPVRVFRKQTQFHEIQTSEMQPCETQASRTQPYETRASEAQSQFGPLISESRKWTWVAIRNVSKTIFSNVLKTVFRIGTPTSESQESTWETIVKVSETIFRLIAGNQDRGVDLSCEDRVPMFWADTTGDDPAIANLIVLLVGFYFGAIHCVAWFFSFPTRVELLIWRISSAAITAVPIYIIFVFNFAGLLENMDLKKYRKNVLHFGPLSAVIPYIIARAFTLVLVFTSLRDLPPGAYETVNWTTFIPHV